MFVYRCFCRSIVAAAFLILVVGQAKLSGEQGQKDAAGKTYTIKLKSFGDVGKAVQCKNTETQTGSMKVSDDTGKVLKEDKMDESQEEIYSEIVLEGGDKLPQKLKLVYDKAVKTVKGQQKPMSYDGVTVILTRKGDQYEVTTAGKGELSPADIKKFARKGDNLAMTDAVLPKNPVKVGETWPVDVKGFASKLEGADLDVSQSKGQAKLIKAYPKDGKQFGIIDVELKMAMKSMGPLKLDKPAIFDMKATLDTAIDGSSMAGIFTFSGKVTAKSALEQGGKKFSIEMTMDMSGKQEQSAEK